MKYPNVVRSPRLTAYALSCGAVENMRNAGPEDFWRVELYREHTVYHVRCNRLIEHPNAPDEWRQYWQSADTVKEARRLFDAWQVQIDTDMALRAQIAGVGQESEGAV